MRYYKDTYYIDNDSTLHIYMLDYNDKQIKHIRYLNVDSIAQAEELVRSEKLDMLVKHGMKLNSVR